MEPLSFFGRFLQTIIVSCFSDSFVQKTAQQSVGSGNVTSDSEIYTKQPKNRIFTSAKTHENYFVSKEDCIARHDDKMCFLLKCRYHFILMSNIKEMLQKLVEFYQHVACLYTLFKYRFSGKNVIKSGQMFDNLQRAVHFNQQNRAVDREPSIAKKRLLRKKFKKHLLSSFQKTKSAQTSRSVCADRIEQVEKTKFE